MSPEEIRLIVVLYLSAILPLGLIPWLQHRGAIPCWSMKVYVVAFLVCAVGWEIWFTYGLLGGEPVTDRRAEILNTWIPLNLNWLLNSLGDAGSVCMLGLFWMWLFFHRNNRVFCRWHWGAFSALLFWCVGQNMLVEMFLYHDQLSVGKTVSWAPLVPTGPWFNPTLFEFHGRAITLQNQVCWVLMSPLLYGLALWFSSRSQSVRVVSAQERFDNIDFDPRTMTREHRINVAEYTCPDCDYRIGFNTHDFFSTDVNDALTDRAKRQADKVRPIDTGNGESFLEFSCPRCKLSVRVVYLENEFAMGCYNYRLISVVEIPTTGDSSSVDLVSFEEQIGSGAES